MILFGASDVLRIVTTTDATLSVMTDYADYPGPDVMPDRQDASSTTATTTIILDAPGVDLSRTVQSMSIVNTHATTANVVTLQLFNGTTAHQKYKVTLAAGESLLYERGHGFTYVNALGLPRSASSLGASAPAVSVVNLAVLASDVINNNAVANTIQDVTGLSFPVLAGGKYQFEFFIDYTAAATTTGSRWAINGPAFSRLSLTSNYALTTGSNTFNNVGAYDQPAASSASAALTTGNVAYLSGFIQPSADGIVIARFASEIAGSAVTAKAGSVCKWIQVA